VKFNSVLIVLTEACHVGCQHCGYRGSPRDREMTVDDVTGWVDQILNYGVPEIIFTGGEPFERLDLLESGVARTRHWNARSSVFTSSFWATSFNEARGVMNRLPGLTTLYLSTDVYHQAQVPLQHVRNAIDAGIDVGVKNISLNITYAREEDRQLIASQYSDYGERINIYADRVIPLPDPQTSIRLLRGQDSLRRFAPHAYAVRCWLGTPLINPNGDLAACHIGKAGSRCDLRDLPYFLGNLREQTFGGIMDRSEARADYQYLRTHGPRGVAQMAADTPDLLRTLPRREFTTECDMCWSVLELPQAAQHLRVYAASNVDRIEARRAIVLGERPATSAALEQRAEGTAGA
jgi:hypothetical protein